MTTDTTAPTAAATPNEAGQDSSRQGPGRLIRLARERARIGISELAALTKLATATLEALERDDFTVLSEAVYVRGYYRKCAKALALSEQELLAAYEKVVAPRAPLAPTKLLLGGSETGSSLKKTRRRSGSPWLLWLIGIAVLVAVCTWFLREDPNGHRAVLAEAPGAAKPVPAEPVAAAPSAPAETAAAKSLSTNELATTPADSGQTAAVGAEPAAQSAPQPTPAPVPAPAPAQPTLATELSTTPPPAAAAAATSAPAAAAPGALSLGFKATSWVRVEDSSGKVLLSGVVQSGDHQVLVGKPPYSLFLGNAPGVSVEYRGEVVDLKPFTKSNDTARLSVPVSG